jgi:hypothetical protein
MIEYLMLMNVASKVCYAYRIDPKPLPHEYAQMCVGFVYYLIYNHNRMYMRITTIWKNIYDVPEVIERRTLRMT